MTDKITSVKAKLKNRNSEATSNLQLNTTVSGASAMQPQPVLDGTRVVAVERRADHADAAESGLGSQLAVALWTAAVRQFRFPKFVRGLTEALIFCGIYLVAGYISLGISIEAMLVPMVPIVLLMMFCMVASGVYREEITNSILNLYIHSIYGFFLASVGYLLLTFALPPEYSGPKFIFFFLYFAFFVMNTLRPIISGTDFMDGGGRRNN